jgi:hypothetical protein
VENENEYRENGATGIISDGKPQLGSRWIKIKYEQCRQEAARPQGDKH